MSSFFWCCIKSDKLLDPSKEEYPVNLTHDLLLSSVKSNTSQRHVTNSVIGQKESNSFRPSDDLIAKNVRN